MNFISRLFGKDESSTAILCPHCERSMDGQHDVETCARKRMSRRYFFGIMGGAAAAMVMPKLLPADLSFDIDAFGHKHLEPAAVALAESFEHFASSGPAIGNEFLVRARKRFKLAEEAEREIRAEHLMDLAFITGNTRIRTPLQAPWMSAI